MLPDPAESWRARRRRGHRVRGRLRVHPSACRSAPAPGSPCARDACGTIAVGCRMQQPRDALLDLGNGYRRSDRSAESGSRAGGVERLRARRTVLHEIESEDASVFVSASDLVPPGEESALGIDDWQLSDGLDKLLVYTNSKRVWRTRSRGDYWVLDRTSLELAPE